MENFTCTKVNSIKFMQHNGSMSCTDMMEGFRYYCSWHADSFVSIQHNFQFRKFVMVMCVWFTFEREMHARSSGAAAVCVRR